MKLRLMSVLILFLISCFCFPSVSEAVSNTTLSVSTVSETEVRVVVETPTEAVLFLNERSIAILSPGRSALVVHRLYPGISYTFRLRESLDETSPLLSSVTYRIEKEAIVQQSEENKRVLKPSEKIFSSEVRDYFESIIDRQEKLPIQLAKDEKSALQEVSDDFKTEPVTEKVKPEKIQLSKAELEAIQEVPQSINLNPAPEPATKEPDRVQFLVAEKSALQEVSQDFKAESAAEKVEPEKIQLSKAELEAAPEEVKDEGEIEEEINTSYQQGVGGGTEEEPEKKEKEEEQPSVIQIEEEPVEVIESLEPEEAEEELPVIKIEEVVVEVDEPEIQTIEQEKIQIPVKENNNKQGLFPVLCSSAYYSSYFGMRKDPFTKEDDFHNGVDINAAYGKSVIASHNGKVVFTGWRGSFGKMVDVQSSIKGQDYIVRYAHLSSISVKVGDEVIASQVIGQVGSTGRSTGPHLHYEVRDTSGSPLNPISEGFLPR